MSASEHNNDVERQTQSWCDRLVGSAFWLNVKETDYMTTNANDLIANQVEGSDFLRSNLYKCNL